MSWIFLAIGAHTFWGLSNVADKYILGDKVKNTQVYLILTSFIGAVLSLIALPWLTSQWPSLSIVLWLTLGSFLYCIGTLWYLKAVSVAEISRINIWWNLIPVFTLVIGWLGIHERLLPSQLLALAVLLTGSWVASVQFNQTRRGISPGLGWIAASCLEFSFYAVIIRHLSGTVSVAFIFIFTSWVRFVFSLGLLFFRTTRAGFATQAKLVSGKIIFWVMLAVGLDYVGVFLNQLTLTRAPAALALSIEGYQALFVFFVSWGIVKWFPLILNEKIDRRNIFVKLVAVVLICLGIFILARG